MQKFVKVFDVFYCSISVFCFIYLMTIKIDLRSFLALFGILFLPIVKGIFRKIKLNDKQYVELMIFIIFAHLFGVCCRWYFNYLYYDLIIHGISGYIFTDLGYNIAKSSTRIQLFRIIFGFCFSLSIALLWEIYEYLGFIFFSHDSQNIYVTGLKDTMEDVIICVVFSCLTAAFYLVKNKKAAHHKGVLPKIN